MKITIRKAEARDIEAIEAIFCEARATIASLGIDQWQNGYPEIEVVIDDMIRDYSRVVELDGEVVATFAALPDGEPTYNYIFDGNWLTGNADDYLTIHRVAISVSARGTGLARTIIEYAAEYATELGMRSVRIDTHRGNIVMRKMLEKNGFSHCGTIFLTDGAERVAYEKFV